MNFRPVRCASSAALAVALFTACTSLPRAFPRFDDSQALPAVVVGRIDAERYLEPFPECVQPDVICMDPPSVLLTVGVLRAVYGPDLKGRKHVATTSHYGTGTFGAGTGDLLLLPLKVNGQSLVLPRYAWVTLEYTASGDLAVPDWGTFPIWWLPCSVMDVREPVEFSSQAARQVEDLEPDDLSGLVRVDSGRALPLFGLRVSRIAEHLAEIQPTLSEMTCERLSPAQ